MNTIGQRERRTQQRVLRLFGELGYSYLGDWTDRPDNRNIEEDLLRTFLRDTQGYSEAAISRALHLLIKAAGDTSRSLYDRNRATYELLRYGVKIKTDESEQTQTVWLIDWHHPEKNHFAVAEEVTIHPAQAGAHAKRPDVVLYVNGIALAVLELKRASVAVAEGVRQNLDNQRREFIEPFFSTLQLLMAGNDSEGLRYATIETIAKEYLAWKEPRPAASPGTAADDGESLLDRALAQLCAKERFLEIVHDFVAFDAGSKKLCRHNQYFGVKAAQDHVRRREGGIVWHTQGSGKSLTMVWLAKWIREHVADARVLLITDRTDLDDQIEGVFHGVGEAIHRTRSGRDLLATLNAAQPWLICSLVHKFGRREEGEEVGDIPGYIRELKSALPPGFSPKGNLVVFVDECHRTQSGLLHDAMKALLPGALFIGFTGTPLLRADKKRSIETFGPYIHTYRFDEAVRDGVVVDIRYEARDIDQRLTSPAKIDQWFEAKTRSLTPLAKARLKQRWGTLRKVLSSQSRLDQIVNDILLDMATRPRLLSGRGNALLVSGSIYQACKLYELFSHTELAGKCAIVTSYRPAAADLKGENTGEGLTEKLRQYDIYRRMLADWFREPADQAMNRVEEFEREVKKKFVKEPGQMKLLIVVDKLLTGFDAPPATYLYIDKEMRDHGLFQAICRVNRLDGEDKDYGYVIDYKDLFKSLEGAVKDYTSGAFDTFEESDVRGLVQNRLSASRDRLLETLEQLRALTEPVEPPKDKPAYYRYFSSRQPGDAEELQASEPRRLALYKGVAALLRAYAEMANEMAEAGFAKTEAENIRREVAFFEELRAEIKIHSGDAIDLKLYEPAMRHLIDTYIQAEPSEKISSLDDLSLLQVIVERGEKALDNLPKGLRKNKEAVAETIENNVRKLIIDEHPINPRYYDRMSELLDALIEERRKGALDYKQHLRKVVEFIRKVMRPEEGSYYPERINTPGRRALYDNLEKYENLTMAVDAAVRRSRQDGWRDNEIKARRIENAMREVFEAAARERKQPEDVLVEGHVLEPERYGEFTETPEEKASRLLAILRKHREY